MAQTSPSCATLTVSAEPRFARLVRMTAANIATLSSMSYDRVEDIRMAAEEAFIFACSVEPETSVEFAFDVDDDQVTIDVNLGNVNLDELDLPEATYADLILTAVCDTYAKSSEPTTLHLNLKADLNHA